MRVRFALLFFLTAVSALAAAPSAHAGFFPAVTVDGPSVQPVMGDVDLARDGDGAMAYVKDDDIYVSRILDGIPQPPQRVDAGAPGAVSSKPSVGVSSNGRVVVTFLNGDGSGGEQLWFALKASNASTTFSAPQAIVNVPFVHSNDVDMGPTGVAYATYATSGDANPKNIRASRLENITWTAVGTDATPSNNAYPGNPGRLDFDVLDNAGDNPAQEPRVAVDGQSNAVISWSEGDVGVDTLQMYVRRITGTNPGTVASNVFRASVDTFQGRLRKAFAWMHDIDVDDAGNASVIFREDFTYGATDRPRALVRRLSGSTFSDPVAIDGLGDAPTEGAEFPRIDVNGPGQGLAASRRQLTFATFGGALANGIWSELGRVDLNTATGSPEPVAAMAGNGDGLFAWQQATFMRARYRSGGTFGTDTVLSDPALGVVDQSTHEAAADTTGNAVIGFTQGAAATRRVMAALYDAPPSPAPRGTSSEAFNRERNPILRWTVSNDTWGAVTYRVVVDGKTLGTTSATSLTLTDALADGTHTWQVFARDARGQEVPAPARLIRVDIKRPSISLTVTGTRRVGRKLRFIVTARDGKGSGIKAYKMAFSQGKSVKVSKAKRRFRKAGILKITIRVRDRVGNITEIVRRVRIAKK